MHVGGSERIWGASSMGVVLRIVCWSMSKVMCSALEV